MSDFIKVVNMIPNLSSGERNQDSEPNIAVNPANPMEIAATSFTPSPNAGSKNSPVFYSNDGGESWSLRDIIAGTPVRDQTLRFASTSGMLYAGVLWGPGGISSINFDILRTNDFSGLTTMTKLASRKNDDQPFVQAATVPSGPGAGDDRVYVGSNDHAPSNVPATVDLSLDAQAAAPTIGKFVIEGRTVSRDGFQTRPAVHKDGVVYALFYALIGSSSSCDVVIVRDDNWGSGPKPFNALIDPGDTRQGQRIVTGVDNPFLGLFLGQQRIGGDLSIAVDPNDSARVYICYGVREGGVYSVRIRRSTDSGATWSGDLRSIGNATNPALAINDQGKLGFVYQQVVGSSSQRWVTTLELTNDDFASFTTHFLANTPATTPAKTFDPYLGDYIYMMAVGRSFYGIFCANNTPDKTNFPNGVAYQRNANFTTHTLLDVDNVTSVATSIDPFFFKVVVGAGRVTTAIAGAGRFGNVCRGSFVDEMLTIDNSGSGPLNITNIVSSSPDFLAPEVLAYPIKLGAGDSIDVMVRFQPTSLGPKAGTITVFSDDPAGPHHVRVSGDAPAPRLSLALANAGDFGKVCLGSFADEPLVLNNGGRCSLSVTGLASSSPDFVVPKVASFPLSVAPGGTLALPIRFAPTSAGAKAATLTVTSDDPAGAHVVEVSGRAPTGKLAVSGSLCFGGVPACCPAERTVSICNVGHCELHIKSVALKRKSRHWKLVNNPFPATLHPGSCLGVVVRYKANERCPRAEELVITSDDPTLPVKTMDLLAFTDWSDRGHKQGCESCGGGCGDKRHAGSGCRDCPDDCCDDGDDDDGRDDDE
jgi:hypothetical protein